MPVLENAYKAIIATGYKTVVLDEPLTQQAMDNASQLIGVLDENNESKKNNYEFSEEELEGCADTDNDGLWDFEEIMFYFSGNPIISIDEDENVTLPTIADILGKGDGDISLYFRTFKGIAYVEAGLEKALIQYGNCYDQFLKKPVMPIISDPTSEDGDEDGYFDLGDHYPIEFEDKNIHKHKLILDTTGQYKCTFCDVEIKSPDFQDKEILSEDDYLQVSCLKNEFINFVNKKYGEDVTLEQLSDAYYSSLYIYQIESIRLKDEYAYKYDFRGNDGKYYSDFLSKVNVDTLKYIFDSTGELQESYIVHSWVETVNSDNKLKYVYSYEIAPTTCYILGFMLSYGSDIFISTVGSTVVSSIPSVMYEEYTIGDLGWTFMFAGISKITCNIVEFTNVIKTINITDALLPVMIPEKKVMEGDKFVYVDYVYKCHCGYRTCKTPAATVVKTYWFRDGELIFYED